MTLFFCFSAGRHCPQNEFQCNNTLCKPLAWKCDGEDDCGDNSDENPEECSELIFLVAHFLNVSFAIAFWPVSFSLCLLCLVHSSSQGGSSVLLPESSGAWTTVCVCTCRGGVTALITVGTARTNSTVVRSGAVQRNSNIFTFLWNFRLKNV